MTTNKEERHKRFDEKFASPTDYLYHEDKGILSDNLKSFIDTEVDLAVAEERERIEAVFKKHVPPHAMDLEDSVWLKRLLNKAFHNDNK